MNIISNLQIIVGSFLLFKMQLRQCEQIRERRLKNFRFMQWIMMHSQSTASQPPRPVAEFSLCVKKSFEGTQKAESAELFIYPVWWLSLTFKQCIWVPIMLFRQKRPQGRNHTPSQRTHHMSKSLTHCWRWQWSEWRHVGRTWQKQPFPSSLQHMRVYPSFKGHDVRGLE